MPAYETKKAFFAFTSIATWSNTRSVFGSKKGAVRLTCAFSLASRLKLAREPSPHREAKPESP
jgi:hypothetical protein